jgi:hypothetical protein
MIMLAIFVHFIVLMNRIRIIVLPGNTPVPDVRDKDSLRNRANGRPAFPGSGQRYPTIQATQAVGLKLLRDNTG